MTMATVETETRERPILFSGPMIRAILAGQKTQTRRIVRLPDIDASRVRLDSVELRGSEIVFHLKRLSDGVACTIRDKARFRTGDRLWVREKHALCPTGTDEGTIMCAYYAGDFNDDPGYEWRPSIHMPRWASRITLEITGVRVQRVQDITEEDARAEGVTIPISDTGRFLVDLAAPVPILDAQEWHTRPARCNFASLWDSINGKRGYGWESNPWCWCLAFPRIEATP